MRLVSITPCVVQSKRSTRICRARSANSTHVGLGHRVSRVRVLRQYVLPAPGEKSSSHSRARLRRDSGRWDLPEPGCSSPGARLPDHLFSRLVDTLHSFGFPHDCFSRRPLRMFRNPSTRFHNTPKPSLVTVHKLPGQMLRPEIDDPSTCAPLSSSRTLPRPVYSSTYVLFAEWWSAAESAIATDSRSCARITSNQVSTLVLSIFGPRRLVDNFAVTGLFHSGAIRCSHWSVRET